MNTFKQISVIGLGLLGASVSLSIRRAMSGTRVVGHSHRESTRRKAAEQGIVDSVAETVQTCVEEADLVVLASPIRTFEGYFRQMAPYLKEGAVVTDVGSTKRIVHQWASRLLPKRVKFVGSHPIAGSEKQGLDFARDDLLPGAKCIMTQTQTTDPAAVAAVRLFWERLGCTVEVMSPAAHDRILAMVSHLPHITAASLVNANRLEDLYLAGTGFIDTSRVASGPANIWTDILLTNKQGCLRGISKLVVELERFYDALERGDEEQLQKLLEAARKKRERLIEYKLEKKELF
ncbi:MAG: prephenate dehydrogenase/arogenate dehydrogenase family protein [Planctomycetes bacterium]|jgi:prephenate dehydrogenase|nr:prephenate dehydrogenase/arogenate dehydrogenase family protein [Planctomycetota bacterium]